MTHNICSLISDDRYTMVWPEPGLAQNYDLLLSPNQRY